MTKNHDWQAHNMLIHQHGNEKFIKPTKRMLDEPGPFQKFPRNHEGDLAHLVIVISSCCVMAIAAILVVVKVFS